MIYMEKAWQRWRRKHYIKYIAQIKIRHAILEDYVYDYKKCHPCSNCGELSPECLDFHHKNEKRYAIADIINHTLSIKTLESEIKKCDVLCANCHFILHYDEYRREHTLENKNKL